MFFPHPYNTCLGETEGSLLFFPEAMCLLWRGQHAVPLELSGCLCDDVFVLSQFQCRATPSEKSHFTGSPFTAIVHGAQIARGCL